MKNNKSLIFTFIFGILTTLITLSLSLTSFLIYQEDYKNKAEFISEKVSSYLDEDYSYEFLYEYFKKDEGIMVSLYTKDTIALVFDSKNLKEETTFIELSKDLNSVKLKKYDNKYYFVNVILSESNNVYIKSMIMLNDTYFVFLYSLIALNIIIPVVFISFYILEYLYYKHTIIYLKKQIRRLREITNEEEIVEYSDDIQNLAIVIRNTRIKLEKEFKNNIMSESRLNYILDSIDQGFLVMDENNKIVISNKKAKDLFLNQIDNSKIKFNSSFEDLRINIKVVFDSKKSMIMNKEIEGRIYEIEMNLIDYEWSNNKVEKAISLLILDVTEEFNSEKMKREFFQNASHELKSPLTTILGYQEMIKEGLLTSEGELNEANIKTIKEGNRMKKLINEMLELSKLENNTLRPIEKLDVSDELNSILSSLELQIKEKELKVIRNYQKLIIKMNKDDFYNLFKNLIDNAIKYNKVGGKLEITINTKEKFISIKDEGIGLNDEDKQRIFERFYRVDKARSRENGGTGLGLAIVKYVCSYYEFEIKVDSSINNGSEFKVYY